MPHDSAFEIRDEVGFFQSVHVVLAKSTRERGGKSPDELEVPKASFIGFTGTPIESGDKNTQAVFGDYIDVYDILQSKEDKATVPIYYEARLAKIDLKPEERPKIDPNFEEVTEDAEEAKKESLRRKWAQLEAMFGTDKRIALVAADLVQHWEARYAAMEGKAMLVCMSRRESCPTHILRQWRGVKVWNDGLGGPPKPARGPRALPNSGIWIQP